MHLHEFECRIPEGKRDQIQALEENTVQPIGVGSWSLFSSMNHYYEDTAHIGDPEQTDEFFSPRIFLDEQKETVGDWLTGEKDKCIYTYDFGDDWRHEIVLERMVSAEPGVSYPFCVKAKREAPSEDSGGVWGWQENDDEGKEGRTDKEITEEINEAFQGMGDEIGALDETSYPAETGTEDASLEEWNKLYQWAIRFKELKSWE